ncbi:unnamed protein product [Gemmataceae bacterium]|nr:unnamed protein product [Gemmataceae bacterium]VTT98801.1 unnamed protein product [Gemmataceae bacterium]
MAVLLKTLKGKVELDRLPVAYCVLATAYLAHRGQATETAEKAGTLTYQTLRHLVLASEDRIPLEGAMQACDLITAEEQRPAEVFDNLCHVEVLIAAISIMRGLGLDPCECAPTQQSQDEEMKAIPDLSGAGWSLEAYGGQNCDSNHKLFEDLCALERWRCQGSISVFLAFREEAWVAYRPGTDLKVGIPVPVRGRTKKNYKDYGNSKVGVSALLTPRACAERVWVVQASDIVCTPREQKAPAGSPNTAKEMA